MHHTRLISHSFSPWKNRSSFSCLLFHTWYLRVSKTPARLKCHMSGCQFSSHHLGVWLNEQIAENEKIKHTKMLEMLFHKAVLWVHCIKYNYIFFNVIIIAQNMMEEYPTPTNTQTLEVKNVLGTPPLWPLHIFFSSSPSLSPSFSALYLSLAYLPTHLLKWGTHQFTTSNQIYITMILFMRGEKQRHALHHPSTHRQRYIQAKKPPKLNQKNAPMHM